MMGRLDWVDSDADLPAEFDPTSAADPLCDFLEWFGKAGPAFPAAPADGLAWAGHLPGVTLYRRGAFQMQLFIFPAGTVVPPHRHPDVDTIEMFVCGNYDFRVDGVSAIPLNHLQDRRRGASRWWGRGVRVRPDDWHDLQVFDGGACFLSAQHWLRGSPTSVGDNWEGAPANPEHGKQLCR